MNSFRKGLQYAAYVPLTVVAGIKAVGLGCYRWSEEHSANDYHAWQVATLSKDIEEDVHEAIVERDELFEGPHEVSSLSKFVKDYFSSLRPKI